MPSTLAIGVSRRRLWAVHATAERGRLVVRRVLVEALPAALRADQPDEVGAWVGRTLHEAHFPRGPVTVALPREQIGLKRMSLPSGRSAELPEMTRLAMQRELPFDASIALIDFLPVERGENSTTVLAVAAPEQVVDFTRRMLRAARLPLQRISVRALGAAALVRGAAAGSPGGVLVVDVSGDSVEFVVVEGGVLRFARSAELPESTDASVLAQAVVTETRRTWMSYRIVETTEVADRALLVGEPTITKESAALVAEALQMPADTLRSHPRIDQGPHDLRCAWPLAGLLLEPLLELPSIDLAHPRRAPDVGARRRQLALAGAGALAVAAVALGFAASNHIRGLEAELATLNKQRTAAYPDRLRFKRDQLKLEHLRHWESVRVDWLEHLRHLAGMAPPRGRLVFDQWSGALSFGGVRYDQGWSAPMSLTLTVEGEAADRQTALAFREALVRDDAYTARSSGADSAGGGKRLPFAFAYTLESRTGSPPPGESGGRGPHPDAGEAP